MKVKEVMTARSLKFCSPETKLHNAAKAMQSGNVGALPVVNKENKVVGLVTDRDIALSLAKKQPRSLAQLEVKNVMTPRVHTVNVEDDVTSVLREMRTNKIGRVPVVDQEGKLKGIVSLHNLLTQTGSSDSKMELGTYPSSGESLLKTIHAVTDRYSNGKTLKVK